MARSDSFSALIGSWLSLNRGRTESRRLAVSGASTNIVSLAGLYARSERGGSELTKAHFEAEYEAELSYIAEAVAHSEGRGICCSLCVYPVGLWPFFDVVLQ